MSAAFPEITPKYTSVSPSLADAIHENLAHSSKTTKVLLELVQRVAIIHDDAAVSILNLVDNFKKKISEVNKAKPNCQNESFQKFISRVFEQMENQAKILQSVGSSYTECVAVPLQETVDKKKEIWKTCFFYTNSFQQQIRKKEEDLVKRYKDYNDAANKLKSSTEADKSKQELMYHNSHNTYLLRLSSVNSMHNLLYTHVLPHVVHSIETNQAEMNDSLRHHVKYMFSVQKETLKKISKSVDKIDHATDKIDLVSDLTKFIKKTKGHVKDKTPPQQAFSVPKTDTNRRMSVAIETLDPNFVLNKFTGPNLQRRLAALQQQTGELVDNIATLRAGERQAESKPSKDPSLDDLVELLSICDKEANLNVLLKQMELYTDRVTGFLGPLPSNVLSERKHTRKSPRHHAAPKDGQTPHAFIQSRLMKPSQCYYCQKLVTTFVKGYVCSSCKMVVHKKCATNVPFCGGVDIKARSPSVSDSQLPSPMVSGKTETAEVYDLIDLESGDEFDYFDDDEFDDTFSDEEDEIHNPPSQQFNILQPTVPNQFNQPSLKPTMSNQYNPPEQKFNQQFNSLQSDLARQLSAPPLPNRQPARPTQEDGASARSNSFNNKLPPPILPTKPGVSPKKPTTAAKPSSSPKPTGSKPKPATSTKPAIDSNKPVISSKPSLSKKPTLAAKPSKPRECIALYDYRSDESSDLSFTSGSIVQILDKTDAEWWKGRLNNYEGFFPCSYVMELIGNQRAVRALYEFNGENPSEINVDEGQILILLEEQDDWFKLKGVDGEGLVPSSYVEFI